MSDYPERYALLKHHMVYLLIATIASLVVTITITFLAHFIGVSAIWSLTAGMLAGFFTALVFVAGGV